MIDFFGRAEIFVGILTINGKIVSVLNLKKKKTPKTDLLFVDADKKKIEECIRFKKISATTLLKGR